MSCSNNWKNEGDQTINIAIKEKNAEAKLLKSELRKRARDNKRMQELYLRLTLLETFIEQQKTQLKALKENVKHWKQVQVSCKKVLETYRTEKVKLDASIVTDVEHFLEQFNILQAAYHGGDFNGVYCRRLVASVKLISNEIREILLWEKDWTCDDTAINNKVDELEVVLGMLDATFAYLNSLHPTEEEKIKAREAPNDLSRCWRTMGLKVTL